MSLPLEARQVLRDGALCHLAAPGPDAPHLTPVVFAVEGDQVWATTARRSRKARLWRERPEAAALVRAGDRALSFRGDVQLYDLLDPATWARSIVRSPTLARAAARFSARNLRFFAGYARDARRVPLGWMPPGRVFFSVGIESWALLDLRSEEVSESRGRMGRRVGSRRSYRALRTAPLVDEDAPPEVREAVGSTGAGALAVRGSAGTTVLPVGWARVEAEGAYLLLLPRAFLRLAGTAEEFPATLTVDRASTWRASQMAGLQLRGTGQTFLPDRLERGGRVLEERVAALPPVRDPAVVRLRPERAVWWRGWATGSLSRR